MAAMRPGRQHAWHVNRDGGLPFSEWDQVFKDPMTTAAAIDRLVHHSVILELNVPSYRMEAASTRRGRKIAAAQQEQPERLSRQEPACLCRQVHPTATQRRQ